MLTTKLINPQVMSAISKCGHGDKILISDGNYPIASKSGDAEVVYLALTRDCPTATEVLEALQSVLNFEKAELMSPGDGTEPEIFAEYKKMLPNAEFESHGRFDYYEECQKSCVKVAIFSGESRTFANILLTVGVA